MHTNLNSLVISYPCCVMLSLLEIQSRYRFQSQQLCPLVGKLQLCASALSWILLPLSEWGGRNAGAFTWEVKNYLLGNRGNRSSLSTAGLLKENCFCAGLALFIHSLEGWHLLFPSGNHSEKGFSYYMVVSFCCQTAAKAHVSMQLPLTCWNLVNPAWSHILSPVFRVVKPVFVGHTLYRVATADWLVISLGFGSSQISISQLPTGLPRILW